MLFQITVRSAVCAAFLAACAVAIAPGESFATTDKGKKMCSAAQIDAYVRQSRESGTRKVVPANFYEEAKKESVLSIYKNGGKHYEGTDAIIAHWNENYALADTRWLAYILATALHESRLFPIREANGATDEQSIERLRSYASRLSNARTRQNILKYITPHPETGHAYFGRGFVQLTWDYNYQQADRRLGISTDNKEESFYWNPVFQLRPNDSVRTLYSGMVYGWYRNTHCLLRYVFPNQRANYKQARDIVNGGLDKAELISSYAVAYEKALAAAGVTVEAEAFEEVLQEPEVAKEQEKQDEVRDLIEATAEAAAVAAAGLSTLEKDIAAQRVVFSEQIVALKTLIEGEETRTDDLTERLQLQQSQIDAQNDQLERFNEELTAAKVDRDRLRALLQENRASVDASFAEQSSQLELAQTERDRLLDLATQQQATLERQEAALKILTDELKIANRTYWEYWFGSSDDE